MTSGSTRSAAASPARQRSPTLNPPRCSASPSRLGQAHGSGIRLPNTVSRKTRQRPDRGQDACCLRRRWARLPAETANRRVATPVADSTRLNARRSAELTPACDLHGSAPSPSVRHLRGHYRHRRPTDIVRRDATSSSPREKPSSHTANLARYPYKDAVPCPLLGLGV